MNSKKYEKDQQQTLPLLCLLLLQLLQLQAGATIRYVKTGGLGIVPYLSWSTASDNWQTVVNACNSGLALNQRVEPVWAISSKRVLAFAIL